MASHDELYPPSIPLRIARPSGTALIVAAVLVVLGAATLFLAPSPERAWNALHFNWMYWSSIAVGMAIFAVALHLTNARWAWSIRRFALGGVAFLPIALVLLPVVFIGNETYFHHWLHPDPTDAVLAAKAGWLDLSFMVIRDIAGVVVLFGLLIWFAYHALRTDVHGLDRAGRGGWAHRWLGRGYGDVTVEAEASHRKNYYIGVFAALAFAFFWGLIAIDLAMSTLPHFYSTMFPVAFFISAFHSGLAMTAIMVVLYRRSLRLEPFITARQFHDLGKLMVAFAVFWMYINWSQYVVIWYGLLPWEQEYFVLKFQEPYGPVVIAAVMMIFVVPFFGLLSRAPKKIPGILAGFGVLLLLGHWLERFLLATPNIFEHPDALPLGLTEIGVALGFLGLFVACYSWFMATFPVLPSPATLKAAGSPLVTVPGPTKIAEA